MIKINIKIILALVAMLLLVSLESAKAQGTFDFVVNGTFDSDLSGWTTINSVTWVSASGGGAASLYGPNDKPASISQIINGLIVGDTYMVSGNYGGDTGSLGVFINGESHYYAGDLALHSFSFTFTAASSTTTLTLGIPFNTLKSTYGIDNISIIAVPEPNSLYLLGMGAVGGLGFLRRKRNA